MENTNKKFRNPFPAIGKVFKYEMISAGRIFLPVYAIMLVLSLIIGVFIVDSDMGTSDTLTMVAAGIIIITSILSVAMIVIIFCIIERRYKKSMLGDEGYLNLTLPVTIGEHLWGRYLADFVWALSYIVLMIISAFFIVIRGWGEMPEAFKEFMSVCARFKLENGFSVSSMVIVVLVNMLVVFMQLCTFIYMTETVIHMFSKHRTLISILVFVVVFMIFENTGSLVFKGYDSGELTLSFFWGIALHNCVWVVINSIVTRLILTYRLNLE